MQKCSICGKDYDGYGNNAQPVNRGIIQNKKEKNLHTDQDT